MSLAVLCQMQLLEECEEKYRPLRRDMQNNADQLSHAFDAAASLCITNDVLTVAVPREE